MIVGCYSMDLYCDVKDAFGCRAYPGQFTGRTESECIRKARKAGWRVVKNGSPDVACPNHRRRRRGPSNTEQGPP